MSLPAVSVVVPTRDRPESLSRCLAALGRQRGVDLEIVVVDDGSRATDAVARIVADAGAILVRLEGRGPAAARNAGVRRARGRVVCFTDDDCAPEPGWARSLSAAVADGASCAGGRTRPGDRSNRFDLASERVTGHVREFSFQRDPARGFLASNNVACLRSLALSLPFDERFGVGGEDRDWCARVASAVGAPVLVPQASVVHTPGLTLLRYWRQQVGYGRGAYRFAGHRVPVPHGTSFHVTLVRDAFRDGPRVGALVVLAQVAAVVGVALEASRHWRDRLRP